MLGASALAMATIAGASGQDLQFDRKTLRFDAPVTGAGEALRIFDATSDTLIVRTRDSDANHRFELFAAEALTADTPPVTQSVAVPKNALFYALGEMPEGEQEDLLIFTERGISVYDPTSNQFVSLVETRSLFRQGTDLRFQRSGFAQDLNDDERFDLLIQDFDGLKVFLQSADGRFAEPLLIPVEPELRLTGVFSNDNISDTEFAAPVAQTPTFNIFPSYIADATGDGQSDISFFIGQELEVFARTGPENFAIEPATVTFPFEVRGNRWRDQILSSEKNTDQRNFREVTVYRILDLNGDDALDVITVNNQASGIFDRSQTFHTYFGTITNGTLSYKATPDHTLDVKGIGGVGFRDVNNDGLRDFVVTFTKISIGKIISFLINRKVTTQTRVYLGRSDEGFSEDEDFRRSRSIRINLSSGETVTPPFGYADFNGDEAIDLMEANSKGRMKFLAGGKDENFKRELGEIRETFPNDGSLVKAEDINGDGRADLIVRYNPFGLDGEDKARELVLLVSRAIELVQ